VRTGALVCGVWVSVLTNFVSVVGGVPNRSLQITATKMSGPIPASFANLVKLQDLDLSMNAFTGTLPPILAGMTQLS
jgi:hypothetical protein